MAARKRRLRRAAKIGPRAFKLKFYRRVYTYRWGGAGEGGQRYARFSRIGWAGENRIDGGRVVRLGRVFLTPQIGRIVFENCEEPYAWIFRRFLGGNLRSILSELLQ